jgi:hypothetical protein
VNSFNPMISSGKMVNKYPIINLAKNPTENKRSSTTSRLVRTGSEWENKHSEPGEHNTPLGGQGGRTLPDKDSLHEQGVLNPERLMTHLSANRMILFKFHRVTQCMPQGYTVFLPPNSPQ